MSVSTPSADHMPSGFDSRWGYAVIAVLGGSAWWYTTRHPANMPVWAPWEFAPLWYLCATLFGFWYGRGLVRMAAAERPAVWRSVVYGLGIAAIYGVLQTHFEYLAQHMFFLNRAQHIVMHHLGPLLIALSWPGAVLARGMPRWMMVPVHWRPVRGVLAVVQQPAIAAVLFVGLVALWLYPPLHFAAMIDPALYTVMNASMVFDGILFWCLVLDPRGKPPARASFAARVIVATAVMMPQIALGAAIAFAGRDLYSFYAWCGRIYSNIGPYADQQYGGLIIWIPAAMMSVVAILVVLDNMRRHDETSQSGETRNDEHGIASGAWTGR